MQIVRRSQITGVEHTMDLDINLEQISKFNAGALIQDAFPHLSAEEREFYLTGVTEDEWQKYMTTDEDEE